MEDSEKTRVVPGIFGNHEGIPRISRKLKGIWRSFSKSIGEGGCVHEALRKVWSISLSFLTLSDAMQMIRKGNEMKSEMGNGCDGEG